MVSQLIIGMEMDRHHTWVGTSIGLSSEALATARRRLTSRLGWIKSYWFPYQWSTQRLSAEGLNLCFRFSAQGVWLKLEIWAKGGSLPSSCLSITLGCCYSPSSNIQEHAAIHSNTILEDYRPRWTVLPSPCLTGLVSSAKAVPRASAAISAAMATGEAMAFAPGRAALSYMMQGSLDDLEWEPLGTQVGPQVFQTVLGVLTAVSALGFLGSPKASRVQDKGCLDSVDFNQMTRTAARYMFKSIWTELLPAKLTDHMHPYSNAMWERLKDSTECRMPRIENTIFEWQTNKPNFRMANQ